MSYVLLQKLWLLSDVTLSYLYQDLWGLVLFVFSGQSLNA